MPSERSELRCEQVIASWAIFATLFGMVWAVESFGWGETLVGIAGIIPMLWSFRERIFARSRACPSAG